MDFAVRHQYTDESERMRTIFVVIVLLCATLALAGMGSYSLGNILMWGIMLCAVLVPVLSDHNAREDAFHPWSYFSFQNLIVFPVGALLVLMNSSDQMELDQYVKGATLITAALLLYWAGYRSNMGVRLAQSLPLLVFDSSRESVRSQRFWATIVLTYTVGWLGRMAAAAIGYTHLPNDLGANWRYTPIIDYSRQIGTLSYMVMLYFLLKRTRQQPAAWLWVVLLVAVEIAAGALDGGRSAVVLPLLYLMMCVSFTLHRFRFRTLVAVYAIAFVLLAPLLTVYRQNYYDALGTSNAATSNTVLSAATNTVNGITEGRYDLLNILEGNTFVNSAWVIKTTLRALSMIPNPYDYEWGNTFVPGLVTMPIPRFIWPNKPVLQPARDVAVRFWGFDVNQKFGTSTSLGAPAESYYNFGWLGLLMFPLLGIGFRFFVERYYHYRELESTYIVRAFFIFTVYGSIRDSFLYYFGGLLQGILLYWIFLSVIHWQFPVPYRASSRAASAN